MTSDNIGCSYAGIRIENENVNLDEGALGTASNTVGLPTSILGRRVANTHRQTFSQIADEILNNIRSRLETTFLGL